MDKRQLIEHVNQTIEEIWILLEKKERYYTNFKLNNQQHVILALIIRHPNMTPSELAQKMAITKSAVSQQLVRLEEEQFILRKQAPQDRRTFIIELAEKGIQYQEELEKFNEYIASQYKKHLSHEELEMMYSSLKKLQLILAED